MKRPLYFFTVRGSGTGSPSFCISSMASVTTWGFPGRRFWFGGQLAQPGELRVQPNNFTILETQVGTAGAGFHCARIMAGPQRLMMK